jgi:hypothetical protein
MNTDLQLHDDARMIVEDFVRLTAGETVAVLSDSRHRAEAEALIAVIESRGNPVIGVDVTQQVDQLLSTDAFWIDPPAHLHSLVQATNVNIFVVDETYGFRLDHKIAGLFQTGPECSIFKVDEGMGSWGLTKDDIDHVYRLGAHIQSALDGAETVRITSPGGTDLTLSLKGRVCLPIMPVPDRGSPYGLSVPLWGEYNWAPIEDSAQGRVVIDGLTEAGKQMDVVSEPVVVFVENGRAVRVEGGKDADEFRSLFATDAGSNVVGELGVGGNPKAIAGRETEKAKLGTIHIGFGGNQTYPGGLNHSVVHFDGVARDVTIEVNGRKIIANGDHCFEELSNTLN